MQASSNGVVLITGASRGLGLGLACLLCAQKVPVVLTARNGSALERVAARLGQNAPVRVVAADAADETAMGKALEAADELGPLAGLVNNAGVIEPIASIPDLGLQAFEAALRTNITGVLVGMRLAMRRKRPGAALRILSISSGAAVHAYAGWAAYCVCKAAVNMLTEVAAAEQPAQSGMSIISVAPGIIETAMQRAIREAPGFPEQGKFIALKESGALLHPVHAAIALDWLVRFSPLELSGRMIDARDDELQAQVQRHRRDLGSALEQAQKWFTELER